MEENDLVICPKCGAEMKHYDFVTRVIRGEYGKKRYFRVERRYCKKCRSVLRVTPEDLYGKKQYEARIIDGFKSGAYDIFMEEFEDYPSEQTIKRWLATKKPPNR